MDKIEFEVLPGSSLRLGSPRYVPDDFAFVFQESLPGAPIESHGAEGTTSFLIGTLQLEVDIASSICLYPCGYCPSVTWRLTSLVAPPSRPGALRFSCDEPLTEGISVGLEDMIVVQFFFDPQTGWFCAGDNQISPDISAVEFATDCMAVVIDGRLVSLWIRPESGDELKLLVASYLSAK